MAGARRGDEEDFRTVYRTLHPALLSYLTARLGDDQAASDAASEVWQVIAHEVFTFEGDSADFRVWALSLARRQIRDHPRPDPAAPATDDIRRPLCRLPPDLADALLLRQVAGLDDAAAARVLGTTAPAVQAASRRATWLVADCLTSRPTPGSPRTEWACAWC
ncbi:RNA polymerase sigma factor [Streptomyces coeruleorubidus]|uniref:RNA polymerase sigma factor n=1 Tax=Streptomyces coeruleorubidus TaxID=116188 RepID=UPI00340BCD78